MFLRDGQHPAAAEGVVRAVAFGKAALVEDALDDSTGSFIVELLPDGIGRHELGHVQHGIRVTGKDAGAGCAIHAALAALRTLAVVVGVDHGTVEFMTDFVELAAEFGHLFRRVFVAGQNLINGVKDDGSKALLLGAADELGGQLVQRHRDAAQIPDRDLVEMVRRQTERRVNVREAVHTGIRVEFKVQVQHAALCALEAPQPCGAFRDGDAQLDQGETLARFGGARDHHLVPFSQNIFDKRFPQRADAGKVLAAVPVRQFVRLRFQPILPLFPAALSDIGFQQCLPVPAPQDARHPAQAGGVAVLLIEGQAVLLTGRIKVVHPFAILGVVGRIDLDDGMDALAARVDQRGAGQLQLLDDGKLLAQLHIVAFDEGIAEIGDVGVVASALHRVETDPRTGVRVAVTNDFAHIVAAAFQLFDELPCGTVPTAFRGGRTAISAVALGNISNMFIGFEQCLQIAFQLFGGMPLRWKLQLLHFHPAWIDQPPICRSGVVRRDLIVPVQRVPGGACPPLPVSQLENAAFRDRLRATVKAFPFAGTFPFVVTLCIAGTPLLPDGSREARLFERHAHGGPLLIIQGGRAEKIQRFFEFVFMFHVSLPSKIESRKNGRRSVVLCIYTFRDAAPSPRCDAVDHALGRFEAPCADVLETIFLKTADLLGGRQSFALALVEPIQQERRLARRFHRIRQDAELLQRGGLFGTGRASFPPEGGNIAGKVFRLNAHLILQRIHKFSLFAPLFFQLLGKSLFTLGNNLFSRLCCGFLDVLRSPGLGQILRHPLRHNTVFADEIGRAAQLVPVGHPQKIEKQQVGFAFAQASAASDHLAVQAADFCGTQDNHAIHRRAVPALSEQHGVAEDIVFSGGEIVQHLAPVGALAVDLRSAEAMGVEQIAEFLARLDERQENDGLPICAASSHFGGDLFEVGVQRGAEVSDCVISAAHAYCGDIQLQRNGLRHDLAQIALPDGIGQFVFVGQRVKYFAEIPHVAAVGRCGHAQHLCAAKVVQNAPVAVRDGVMSLINDDGAEVIMRKTFQSSGTLQGLDAAHDDAIPAIQAGRFGFFHGADKAGGTLQLVRSLFQQLASMGKDEHPITRPHLIGSNGSEHDGLAGAGR
nr:MAG TPA: hypothetical protein [Caudoviricetes sp.]